LVDANWIFGRQNGYSRTKLDAICLGCDTGKNCIWGGDGEIVAVVFSNIEAIEANLLSLNRLGNHVSKNLAGGFGGPIIFEGHIPKGV
jgi:hypothetical protein